MKKTLFALLAMAGVGLSATETVTTEYIVTFGNNTTANHEQKTFTQDETDISYNYISTTSGSAYTVGSLWTTEGEIGSVGFKTGSALSGGNGQITGGFQGTTTSITSVFGSATMMGTISGGGGFTISSAAVGSYELYVLAGRGNKYNDSDIKNITYSLNGSRYDNIAASILGYKTTEESTAPTVSQDGTKITAITTGSGKEATDWVLMKFSFDVIEAGDIWLDSQGGACNIAAVKMVQTVTVPEPTTATLSLLALAGLAARRRRK